MGKLLRNCPQEIQNDPEKADYFHDMWKLVSENNLFLLGKCPFEDIKLDPDVWEKMLVNDRTGGAWAKVTPEIESLLGTDRIARVILTSFRLRDIAFMQLGIPDEHFNNPEIVRYLINGAPLIWSNMGSLSGLRQLLTEDSEFNSKFKSWWLDYASIYRNTVYSGVPPIPYLDEDIRFWEIACSTGFKTIEQIPTKFFTKLREMSKGNTDMARDLRNRFDIHDQEEDIINNPSGLHEDFIGTQEEPIIQENSSKVWSSTFNDNYIGKIF